MTIELEERIAASLHRRAASIEVEVPEPDLTRIAPRQPRRHRLEVAAVAAALVLFVAAGAWIALAGRDNAPSPSVDNPTYLVPDEGALSQIVDPAALVSMTAPWRFQQFVFTHPAQGTHSFDPETTGTTQAELVQPPFVEYRFTDGTKTLQLNFYESDGRAPVNTTPTALIEVRDTTGNFLDYGDGRYRIQWEEGDRTWEADGTSFASINDLATTLDTSLRWQNDTDWADAAPAGLADALLSNPNGNLGWFADVDPHLRTDLYIEPDTAASDPPVLTARRCRQPQPALVVYLNNDAAAATIDQVAQYLDTADGVESYEYIDHDAAYADFRELFALSPQMIDSVTPADLPTSFTVVATSTRTQSIETEIRNLTAVKQVIADPCSPSSN